MPHAPRPQHVFIVHHTEPLTRHMVRVHLGGPAFDDFVTAAEPARLSATDHYVKLLLPHPAAGLEPPYDLAALRDSIPSEDMPLRRTYTVRTIDVHRRTIAIDFVLHDDGGIASQWAAAAQPGDPIALTGPGGNYSPDEDPGVSHVLLADESALPATASALAAMPERASGIAIVEVDGPEDEQAIVHPAGVQLRWLHRAGATPGELLVDAARSLTKPSGRAQVFAHGERSAMKAIRRILQDDWGLSRTDISLSAYWALGRAEDRFQAEKREPVGVIFPG